MFLDTLHSGDSIEAIWDELSELHGMNAADLQRALQRAEQLRRHGGVAILCQGQGRCAVKRNGLGEGRLDGDGVAVLGRTRQRAGEG